jgi:hypothetical protein
VEGTHHTHTHTHFPPIYTYTTGEKVSVHPACSNGTPVVAGASNGVVIPSCLQTTNHSPRSQARHVSSSSHGMHVSSSSHGMHVSSSSYACKPPTIHRDLKPDMYPPPHMTCMYPPPHMTCMYPPLHMPANRQSFTAISSQESSSSPLESQNTVTLYTRKTSALTFEDLI